MSTQADIPETLGAVRPAPYNPRRITEAELARLGRSMTAFGDLSVLVFNRRTGHTVSGHQRIKHLPPESPITITETLEAPNEQGTVALGYVTFQGERWAVRIVDWDLETERLANIAANQHGGAFTRDDLAEILAGYDPEMQELAGFGADDLSELLESALPPEPPEGFPEYDENIDTDYECPKCGYQWSGQPT